MRRRALTGGVRDQRAQSLVEFAALAPVFLLLIFGLLDLGRGFYYQTEATDAARNAARVLIAPSGTTGPGYTTVCNEAQRDLSNVGVANVACQQMTLHGPPYVAGVDYTQPASNSALVLVYCGEASDCATVASSTSLQCDLDNSPHTCVAVTAVYTFSFLTPSIQQLAGPSLTVQDTAWMVTLW